MMSLHSIRRMRLLSLFGGCSLSLGTTPRKWALPRWGNCKHVSHCSIWGNISCFNLKKVIIRLLGYHFCCLKIAHTTSLYLSHVEVHNYSAHQLHSPLVIEGVKSLDET
ncbi:hypothetical protein O6H91_Y500100 [Diphasiastrum complanatum]|nr:hypothetical protein O6H91_Y500100 [Diphasiastrum complanatum]